MKGLLGLFGVYMGSRVGSFCRASKGPIGAKMTPDAGGAIRDSWQRRGGYVPKYVWEPANFVGGANT